MNSEQPTTNKQSLKEKINLTSFKNQADTEFVPTLNRHDQSGDAQIYDPTNKAQQSFTFGKLYKEESGEFIFKNKISDALFWVDAEISLWEFLLKQNPKLYGSGKYKLTTSQGDKFFNFDLGEPENVRREKSEADRFNEYVKMMNSPYMLEQVKANSQVASARVTSESAIISELIKNQNVKPAGDSLTEKLLLEIISKSGVFNQEKPKDDVDTLLKWKQLGIIPETKDPTETSLSFIEKINPLLTILQGEKPSWISEALKHIGPAILQVGSGAIEVLKNNQILRDKELTFAAQKLKMNPPQASRPTVKATPVEEPPKQIPKPQKPMSQPTEIFQANSEGRAVVDLESIGQPSRGGGLDVVYDPHEPSYSFSAEAGIDPAVTIQPNNNSNGGETMFPGIKLLKDAIQTDNPNFFPELREMLLQLSSEENFDRLLDGQITIQGIINQPQVKVLTGAWITDPKSIQYFENFLIWAREAKAKEVWTRCSSCSNQVIFNSEQDFLADSACDQCGQLLEKDPLKGK